MPRQPINEYLTGRGANGFNQVPGGSTTGDPGNGHYIPEPLDGMVLQVNNNDAGAQSVQFLFASSCAFEGAELPGLTQGKIVSIPAGTLRWFSGFALGGVYENPIDGVTVAGVTVIGLKLNVTSANLLLRVLRLPTAVSGA